MLLVSERLPGFQAFVHHASNVDADEHGLFSLASGKSKQRFDKAGKPRYLGECRVEIMGVERCVGPPDVLEPQPQGSERRAELVRCIGDEGSLSLEHPDQSCRG